jgi:hypothetical protein
LRIALPAENVLICPKEWISFRKRLLKRQSVSIQGAS